MTVSTPFLMGPDESFLSSSWCFYLNFINSFSWFSKLLSDREISACNFLSNWLSEDRFSLVIVSTLFSMCSDENRFDFSFRCYLKCCRSSSYIFKNWSSFLVKDSFRWMMNQSRSCVVCRDIFLSTATVILPVV